MKQCGGNRLASRMGFSDFKSAGNGRLARDNNGPGRCSSSIVGGWQIRTTSTLMLPSFDPDNLEHQPVAVFSALGPPAFRGNEVTIAYYLDEVLRKVDPLEG